MNNVFHPAETTGSDHPPARSNTPTAWAALGLVALIVVGWMFSDQLLCGVIRTGAAAWIWKRGENLRIGRLEVDASGSLRATDVEWSRGKGEHRSTLRCDMVILTPAKVREMILPKSGHERIWIRELWLSKTRLLFDSRGETVRDESSSKTAPVFAIPPTLLPGSLYAGPIDGVFIGEWGRFAIHDLRLDLPSRWTGRVAFRTAETDFGAGHRVIPGSDARAYWEPGSIKIGNLMLGDALTLGEFTLRLLPGRLDFGLRGTIGKGLIRGDGSLGGKNQLEVTLVGEQLAAEAVAGLVSGKAKASGTIDQARISFRGNPHKPMDADGSVRLVARNFQWDGRGWESLRLAASMTGRNLTLSQLSMRQGENELTADGRSSLPGDWHAILRAPFTANFQASLTDAGSLASLFGPDASLFGGTLYLDGSIRGADNKAEGYCNFTGLSTKFRHLSVDWVKGCLIFDGPTSRIPYAEAAAGTDAISLSGWSVENSRPHAYKGEAEVSVKDLARRLRELEIPTSPAIGAGALTGSWKGEGDISAHRGEFRVRFTEWISRWTKGGISGTVEGNYTPDSLCLGKIQMTQDDLTLALRLVADRQRLDMTSISVVKDGSSKSLASGQVSLPVDFVGIWAGGDPVKTLAMDQPLTVKLVADGLRADQFAELLGQDISCAGKIGGWITLDGTPAVPQLNGAVTVVGFSPRAGSPTGDLTMAFQTSAGETKATCRQENGKEALDCECTLPVKLTKNNNALFLDDAVKMKGLVKFRKFPLDGWNSILGGVTELPFAGLSADGEVTFSGKLGQPTTQGRLELKASGADLFGPSRVEDLTLPVTFSNMTAVVGQGAGRYRGQPLALSGYDDWSAGWSQRNLSLRISGTNLPVTLAPELQVSATADLTYSRTAPSSVVLGGALLLDPIRKDLARRFEPAFCPPSFRIGDNKQVATPSDSTMLNLYLSTTTNTTVYEGPNVDLNLHLTGGCNLPTIEGSVTATKQTLRTPGGLFVLPLATITYSKESSRLSGTAAGITGAGFGLLELGGGLEKPSVGMNAGRGITAADWVLACTMTGRHPTAAEILPWLRQDMLLSVPAKTWSTRPSSEANPACLGFYGTPWIWNFLPDASAVPVKETAR